MDYLQEARIIEEVEHSKRNKFFWFLFFMIVFIILSLAIYFIFSWNYKHFSSDALIEGVAIEIGESDAVKFKLDEEDHGMKINFVGEEFVSLTISSEPIEISLALNEIKEVDLNKDGILDIKIRLVSIVNGKATVIIIKIQEREECSEDWRCSEWSSCIRGKQTRRCFDLSSCGTIFNRLPLKRECTKLEFMENKTSSEKKVNNANNSPSSNINYTIKNITNFTSSSNLVVCPVNNYACYESMGYFCAGVHNLNNFNPVCCLEGCLIFGSKERFCFNNKHFYFEGNETHICNEKISIPFNGTDISCCKSIIMKTNYSVSCANQGEYFSSVYTNEYPEHCCGRLTEWESGMDTRISISDVCYSTMLLSGNPIGTCINCGNRVCEEIEDVCNCPADCLGKEKSDYKTITEFCSSNYGKNIISHCAEDTALNLPICNLCSNSISSTI